MFINNSKPLNVALLGDARTWTVDDDVVAIYSAQHRVVHLVDADTYLPLATMVKIETEAAAEAAIKRHFPDFRA